MYMAAAHPDIMELSILISEDDPTEQFLVKRAINEINNEIDVNIVYSCEQLLDFFLKDKLQLDLNRMVMPDLVIANYSQPFCDLKVIADIRKKEHLKNIPIYIFVNEKIENTRAKFLEYGVTDVFEKPSTYAGLKDAIEKIINSIK